MHQYHPDVQVHMADLGHNGDEDIVFENIQARYRTELLFNKANEISGILLAQATLPRSPSAGAPSQATICRTITSTYPCRKRWCAT